MFDMNSLLSELDEENAALESLMNDLDNLDVAEEGLFSKPKSVDQLLAKVQKTVDKKCKTAEAAQAMLDKLNGEKKKYNDAWKKMRDAAAQFKDGKIDKKGLQAIIKPAAKDLKKTCDIINITEINTNKTDDITDEEVQKLRDFLTGAEQILADKIASFGGSSEGDTSGSGNCDGEGCGAEESCKKKACEGYDESAMEGFGDLSDDDQAKIAGSIGAAVVSFGVAIAMMAKSGAFKEAKYLKTYRKTLKPGMKKAKEEFKAAKKAKDWNGCIAALKKTIELNKQLRKEADSMAKDVEVTNFTTDYKGNTKGATTSKERRGTYKVNQILDKTTSEIKKAEALIKQYQLKAKGVSSATEAAFIEGYQACLAALEQEDMIDEPDETDVIDVPEEDPEEESATESFSGSEDDDDDDVFSSEL